MVIEVDDHRHAHEGLEQDVTRLGGLGLSSVTSPIRCERAARRAPLGEVAFVRPLSYRAARVCAFRRADIEETDMRETEGLDDGLSRDEPVSGVGADEDSGYAPAETAVLGGMLDEAMGRDLETGHDLGDGRDAGVEPRQRDAEQGPPHVATSRGDGKEAEVTQRDHLGDDTDEDGERVG